MLQQQVDELVVLLGRGGAPGDVAPGQMLDAVQAGGYGVLDAARSQVRRNRLAEPVCLVDPGGRHLYVETGV